MQIRLELFGTFRLTKNGRVINFARKKSKGLLAYLVLHPKQHSRERLASMFWSESDIAGARRALRVSLTEIRSALGESLIISEQDSIRFNSTGEVWVDALEFQSVSKLAPQHSILELKKYLSLYQGDLLEEFYDEWIIQLREKYFGIYINVLLQGANSCRVVGNYSQAIEFAQQAIQADPVNEVAHQHWMVCLAAQGQVETAIKVFGQLQKKMLDEFEVAPSLETQKLYEKLQQQKADSSSLHYITNLPQPTTSFIGRHEEIGEIKSCLQTHLDASNLITLKGPGGVGKSRLALEVARLMLNQYPDGVWWIDLAQISEAKYVAPAVARIAGIKEKATQDLLHTLVNVFANKKILLILDNCEHILTGCADLAEKLLRECKQIHFLVTSREPLKILKEQILIVEAMPLPNPENSNFRALLNNEAVKLFVERASFITTSFRASESNIQDIVEICKKLEGFPLAIELIAAQAHDKNLQDIKLEISKLNKKRNLTKSLNLQATIQWSYDLLNETEKTLFRRLAIFAGYWNEKQAIQIAGGYFNSVERLYPQGASTEYVLPISADIVIRNTLLSLSAKSLINLQSRNESMQFVMLDTIRQFALQKLKENREYQQASLQHATYYLSYLHQVWGSMYTPAEKSAMDEIEFDYSNIRLALIYTFHHKKITWTKNNIASFGRFCTVRGRFREGREWLTKILAHPSLQKRDVPRATALNNAGLIAWDQGDQNQARVWFQQAIQIQKKVKDLASLSLTLLNFGNTFFYEGDYIKARSYYEESLVLARRTKNERALSIVLDNLAATIMDDPKHQKRAEKLLLESLTIRKKRGDKRGVGLCLNNLGDFYATQGKFAKARKHFEESLRIRYEINDPTGMLTPLLNLANLFLIKKIKLNDVPQILGYVEASTQRIGIKLSAEANQVIAEIKKSSIEKISESIFNQKYKQGGELQIQTLLKIIID